MVRVIAGTALVCISSSLVAQIDWSPEQQQVVDAIEGYLNAWNNSDAAKLASFCDKDYDRIDARGNIYHGREEILRHYTKVFATPSPEGVERRLKYELFSVRIVAPNTAIVDARYTVSGVGPEPSRTIEGMNTVVLIRKDDRWLRVAHRQRVPAHVSEGRDQKADRQ